MESSSGSDFINQKGMNFAPVRSSLNMGIKALLGPTAGWRHKLRVRSRCRRMPRFKLHAAVRSNQNNNSPSVIARSLPARGRQSMKRKPDILWVLVIIFGLGVVTTGYTQSLWERQSSAPENLIQQQP
jgi:hypothetical protein